MKGRFDIKPIRKKEAFMLRKNGFSNYVLMSKSRNPKYYVVEEKRVLKFLDDFRNSIKVN